MFYQLIYELTIQHFLFENKLEMLQIVKLLIIDLIYFLLIIQYKDCRLKIRHFTEIHNPTKIF